MEITEAQGIIEAAKEAVETHIPPIVQVDEWAQSFGNQLMEAGVASELTGRVLQTSTLAIEVLHGLEQVKERLEALADMANSLSE
jgi:hypothetical protein